MTSKIIFDLGNLGYESSYAMQTAAVGIWLSQCLKQGGSAEHKWTDAMHRRAEKRATDIKLDDQLLDGEWGRIGIRTGGYWTLTQADARDHLMSVIAAPLTDTAQGSSAHSGMFNARTASSRLRIMTYRYTRRDQDGQEQERHRIVAAVVERGALYLFDPTFGLWYHQPEAAFNRSAHWLHQALQRTHTDELVINEMTTHIVEVTDVFVSWFGPPVESVQGYRSDIAASSALAGNRYTTNARPSIRFCCQARYASEFPDLPNVEKIIIDEHLYSGPVLTEPDFSNLHACVSTVIRQSMRTPDNHRARLNAKNVWSLYCVFRYGGYHLDADVVPFISGSHKTRLLSPSTFGSATVRESTVDGQPVLKEGLLSHVGGNFGQSGIHCMALSRDSESDLEQVLRNDAGIHSVEPQFEDTLELPDVSILRSPAGDHGAERALRTYLYLWFRLASNADDIALRKRMDRSYGHAMLSAVATGLTHDERRADAHSPKIIRSDSMFTLDELGLEKASRRTDHNQRIEEIS